MSNWNNALQEVQNRDNLMIVDGLNLAMRFKHAGKTEFKLDYLQLINSLAKSYSAKKVVVLSDRGGSLFRQNIDPKYKQNRKDKYQNQTEEEAQAFLDFIEGYNAALEFIKTHHTVVVKKGVEADDMAAYLTISLKEHFSNVWLISTDADWDQLLDTNVHRFSYTSRKEIKLDNFYEMTGCDTPEQLTHVKAIMGDRGDNVIGVDGVGIKRAYGLVRQHGSVFEIVSGLPWPGKQLYIKKLNELGEGLLTNLMLVDLPTYCGEAIEFAGYLDDINELVEELKNDK